MGSNDSWSLIFTIKYAMKFRLKNKLLTYYLLSKTMV